MQSGKNSTSFKVSLDDTEILEIPIIGEYNVQNALVALTIADYFGLSMLEVKAYLEHFELTENRSQWMDGVNGSQILNDAYNASPTSMTAVLEAYAALPREGRKFVLLGDIRELGEKSSELHASLSASVKPEDFDEVYLYGEEIAPLYQALEGSFPLIACIISKVKKRH